MEGSPGYQDPSNSETNYRDALKSYGFLSSFPNLNNVTVTSYKYLHHPLISFSARCNVKELTIRTGFVSYQHRCKIKLSLDLQSVEIDIRKNSYRISGNDTRQSATKQIVDIVSKMRNVEKITLISGTRMADLHQILEVAPNIRTLSISKVRFWYYPVEIWKIARLLRKIGSERGQRNLVHLIVEEMQMRELSVYEKENIMTASVDVNL